MALNQERRTLWTLVSGIGLISVFYGWVAYATTAASKIENEVNTLAQLVSQSSATVAGSGSGTGIAPQNTLDASAQDMMVQGRNQVESQQNLAVNQDMFAATTMPVQDKLVTQHLSNYCDSTVEQGGNCPSDPLLVYGDTKVSSILSGSVYDATRSQAASAFLNTLLSPLDSSAVSNFQSNIPINADVLTKDPALKQLYVQALSDEALLSVVRQSFAEMMSKRTPTGTGTATSPALSEMQLMEKNAVQRFMSSTWTQNLSTMTASQIQQELALMQAYQLWMNYQSYKQTERVEALLAATLLQLYRAGKNANAIVKQASTVPASATTDSSNSDTDNVSE